MAELTNENYYHYDTSADAWSVIFSNRNGLSKLEVESIFSKFGPIKRVIQTGDSYGFCIVKFTCKEAARNCIAAGPKARDFIKMREFDKDKSRATRKTDNSSLLKDSNKNNYTATTASDRLKNLSSGKIDKRNSSKEYDNSALNELNKNGLDVGAIHSSDDRQKETNGVIKSTNHQSIGLNLAKNSQTIPTENNGNLVKNDNLKRTKFQIAPRMPNFEQLNGKEKSNSVLHEQKEKTELKQSNNLSLSASLQQKDETGGRNEFLDGREMSSLSINSADLPRGLPELIESKARIIQKSIHPFCNASWCREYLAPPRAHEIIVANIDKACDEGFILNLFKDFEPLYITNMKVHGDKYFRYCHVYFKSYEHAEAVERTYDRMEIYGKDLIVLRPESFAAHI